MQYPVLYKSINARHLLSPEQTGVPFPNQALTSVQHATFHIDVINASARNVGRTRTALALQSAIVHGLSGTSSISLSTEVYKIEDLDELERPPSMLEASLSTLRGVAKEARFDMAVTGHSTLSLPVAIPILAALFRPFEGAGLDSLTLNNISNDMPLSYNWEEDEAYCAYRLIAPKLRALQLRDTP
jgi:hypothetical protein